MIGEIIEINLEFCWFTLNNSLLSLFVFVGVLNSVCAFFVTAWFDGPGQSVQAKQITEFLNQPQLNYELMNQHDFGYSGQGM